MSVLKSNRPVREDRLITALKEGKKRKRLIVEIDYDLFHTLKKKVAEEDITLKQLVSDILYKYVKS
jgi:hypothetical protein